MSTDRTRIQVYIDPELYDYYQNWKQEKGIEKDSAAFNQLLREYFGKKAIQSSELSPSPNLSREDIEELIAEECELRTEEIKRSLDAKLPTKSEIEERVSEYLKEQVEQQSLFWINLLTDRVTEVSRQVEVLQTHALTPERVTALIDERVTHQVTHLGGQIDVKLTQSVKSVLDEQFGLVQGLIEQVSRLEDARKMTGDRPEETEPPSPPSESPDEVHGDLPSELPDELPKSLNQAELARRFKMNAGQVHKKREQLTAGAFAEWSKSKDPDQVAWEYHPKPKVYVPLRVKR